MPLLLCWIASLSERILGRSISHFVYGGLVWTRNPPPDRTFEHNKRHFTLHPVLEVFPLRKGSENTGFGVIDDVILGEPYGYSVVWGLRHTHARRVHPAAVLYLVRLRTFCCVQTYTPMIHSSLILSPFYDTCCSCLLIVPI